MKVSVWGGEGDMAMKREGVLWGRGKEHEGAWVRWRVGWDERGDESGEGVWRISAFRARGITIGIPTDIMLGARIMGSILIPQQNVGRSGLQILPANFHNNSFFLRSPLRHENDAAIFPIVSSPHQISFKDPLLFFQRRGHLTPIKTFATL